MGNIARFLDGDRGRGFYTLHQRPLISGLGPRETPGEGKAQPSGGNWTASFQE